MNIWEIEKDSEYLAWYQAIWDASPLPIATGKGKLAAGQKAIGRSLVLVEPFWRISETDGNVVVTGKLNVGVRLNTGEEFWKLFDGNFDEMVYDEILRGWTMKNDKSILSYGQWLKEHGNVKQLEFCSSHVGGFVAAIFDDNERIWIDES